VADDAKAASRVIDPQAGDGLADRLGQLTVSLFDFAQDRLDLLRWEAAHEGSRLLSMLFYGFCALLLALFTFETLTLLIVAIFWDTAWRWHAIGGVTGAALIGTLVMCRAFLAKRNEKSSLLHPAQPLAADFSADRSHDAVTH